MVPTAGLRCRSSGGYVCSFSCHSKPDIHFLADLCYHELSFLIRWPSKEQVRKKWPASLKYFPWIIDCNEWRWHGVRTKTTTSSNIISVTPHSSFSFVSHLWPWNVSDRRLVQESGFLDLLEYEDNVMADWGFIIRDLLALRGAHSKQSAPQAMTKTRLIARARIHVERAIGRLKQFTILQGVIPLKRKRYATRWFIVSDIAIFVLKRDVKLQLTN